MSRYKITVEYFGEALAGWQRQKDMLSVQELLEESVFRFSGETVTIHGSGRTDAGVHALGQVAHFDLAKPMTAYKVTEAFNFYLKTHEIAPNKVTVLDTCEVDENFHSRFSAKKRRYEYRIINRSPPLAVDFGRAWHIPERLDAGRMHEAAQILVGHHDFSSFRASFCQSRSPEKTLDKIEVTQEGERIFVRCEAKSFLHHQVRNMTGSLRLIGNGKWSETDLRRALEARSRAASGETAPACGLYFMGVEY